MKALYAEKDRLIELRDTQRENFSNHRDYERELRTVSANIDIILGKSHEQEQQIEKEQNLKTGQFFYKLTCIFMGSIFEWQI